MYVIQKTENFHKWLLKLQDFTAKGRILARIKRAELGNLGDYKSVGKGLFEFRIDSGPGYRVYFTIRGNTLIILLSGGTKSTQERDIWKAKKY